MKKIVILGVRIVFLLVIVITLWLILNPLTNLAFRLVIHSPNINHIRHS